jgi:hypothetical protein
MISERYTTSFGPVPLPSFSSTFIHYRLTPISLKTAKKSTKPSAEANGSYSKTMTCETEIMKLREEVAGLKGNQDGFREAISRLVSAHNVLRRAVVAMVKKKSV